VYYTLYTHTMEQSTIKRIVQLTRDRRHLAGQSRNWYCFIIILLKDGCLRGLTVLVLVTGTL
jgi:hypothetical protein